MVNDIERYNFWNEELKKHKPVERIEITKTTKEVKNGKDKDTEKQLRNILVQK